MYTGNLIFSQVMTHLPMHTFRRCVQRYRGHHKIKTFTCSDQFRCMAFAQLTYRDSLLDIEACLRAQRTKLYHMGIRGGISCNTLANANQTRDWRIYVDFAQSLIHTARTLYLDEDFGIELDNTVYALDATTIDLCLSVFPWAHFRKHKAAVKLHTLLGLLIHEAGAFYVMDRGYLDFARLYALNLNAAFFVTRARSNLQCRRLHTQPVDKTTSLRCDQTIVLTNYYSKKDYSIKLRRIKYHDAQTNKTLVFLTNNFTLPALTICELYRYR